MKKIIISIVVCVFALFAQTGFAEENNVKVTINGEVLNAPIPARIVNERTMLPMRAVFESLGASVMWVDNEQIIFAVKDDTVLTMKTGYPYMTIQKAQQDTKTVIELDTAPHIENDFTLVPVRAVAEGLGAEVKWNEDERVVSISID